MIVSFLEYEGIQYFSLHAEQVISSTYFESNIGIYTSELFADALIRIETHISRCEPATTVLDFERIESAVPNLNKILGEIAKKSVQLILTNVKKLVFEKLDIALVGENPYNEKDADGTGYKKFYFDKNSDSIMVADEEERFNYNFADILSKYTIESNQGYHSSSSVYLSKYIDIKKLISVEQRIFTYALYWLAIKIQVNWNIRSNANGEVTPPTLVCQNLNSSYMASILSTFLRLDVLILDHLGPINTMYSSLSQRIVRDKEYIIVSDVVCLGTEVKIAKTLINFLGGKVFGNVSMVKLDTLKEEHSLVEQRRLPSISVFNINAANNSTIGFHIKTALDLNE